MFLLLLRWVSWQCSGILYSLTYRAPCHFLLGSYWFSHRSIHSPNPVAHTSVLVSKSTLCDLVEIIVHTSGFFFWDRRRGILSDFLLVSPTRIIANLLVTRFSDLAPFTIHLPFIFLNYQTPMPFPAFQRSASGTPDLNSQAWSPPYKRVHTGLLSSLSIS